MFTEKYDRSTAVHVGQNKWMTRNTDRKPEGRASTPPMTFCQYLNTLLTSSGATRSGHRVLSFSFIATNFAHKEPGPAGTSLDFISSVAFERRTISIRGSCELSDVLSSWEPEEGEGSIHAGFQYFRINPAAVFQHTYRGSRTRFSAHGKGRIIGSLLTPMYGSNR